LFEDGLARQPKLIENDVEEVKIILFSTEKLFPASLLAHVFNLFVFAVIRNKAMVEYLLNSMDSGEILRRQPEEANEQIEREIQIVFDYFKHDFLLPSLLPSPSFVRLLLC
jgi:hypothetical protein